MVENGKFLKYSWNSRNSFHCSTRMQKLRNKWIVVDLVIANLAFLGNVYDGVVVMVTAVDCLNLF